MSDKSLWRDSVLSSKRRQWLAEAVVSISDYAFTRQEIATLCETPSTIAASRLQKLIEKEKLTINQLASLGMHGLLTYDGVGEAQVWIALCLIDVAGYSVDKWIVSTSTTKDAISHAAKRRQKKVRKERAVAAAFAYRGGRR